MCVLTTTESRARIGSHRNTFEPPGSLGCCPFYGGADVVVDLLFYVPPIAFEGSLLVFVFCMYNFNFSSFAIILTRERELVTLILSSVGCLVTVNVL